MKERLGRTNFFGEKREIARKNTQTRDDSEFSYQNKYRTLQRMDGYHSFLTKTDTLLQGIYGCNWSGEINRLFFKKLNA